MTKEDVHEVQKKWESYVWQRRLSLICRIQCIKEHTVIARTVEILDQYARTVTVITILKGDCVLSLLGNFVCATVHTYYTHIRIFFSV